MSISDEDIKTELASYSTRRRFLNLFISSTAFAFIGMMIYPVLKYLAPPKSNEAAPTNVLAGEVGELKKNSGKIFRFGTKPGILIDTPSGEIRAFSAVCTHLECTVQYRADLKEIWCACHNGHYDLNGINIAGPPPRPLERYNVNIKGDKIFVHRNV